MKEYYVYNWINPKTNEVFYVGKGKYAKCYNRAYNKHHSGRCQNKKNKLHEEGYTDDDIVSIIQEFNTEKEALEFETSLIEKHGIIEEGGTLFNFRKNGTETGSYQKYREKDIQDIIEAYESGMTMLQIGEDYNIHETTVRRYLMMYNVKIRPGGYTKPHPHNWSEIVKKLKGGRSKSSLSKEYKICYPTFNKFLRERPDG